MKLIECIQTKNPSYSSKRRQIIPVGIIVHSTAANNPTVKRYVDYPSELGVNLYGNHWNKATAKKSMHAFIGYDKKKEIVVAHTLPYNSAAWGAGQGSRGSQNYNPQAHIQFEICEDGLKDINYYKKVFGAAEEYCAYLCKLLNLPASSIIGHYEAHSRGIANNHGDPRHWMRLFGDSMDAFRSRVAARLAGAPTPTPAPVVDDKQYTLKVKLTRSENAAHYKVPINTVVTLKMEDYIQGVVPAEIGNAPVEASKAQAVAARSIAYYWTMNGATITDTSTHQAFRAPRAVDSRYALAHQGVAETAGQILLYNGKVAQTYFAHSNGGRTINNKERWTGGDALPYLVNREDPWTAATGEPVSGHKIGISQVGIIYAANQGVGYREMLEFYYPGTRLIDMNTLKEIPNNNPIPQPVGPLYKATVVTRNPMSLNIWSDVIKTRSIRVVPRGDVVSVIREQENGWKFVQYNGTEGYVDGQYLVKVVEGNTLYTAEVVTRNPKSLNIWEEPANKKKSLAQVPKGAIVNVLAEVDPTWARIQYANYVGYSDRQYLKRK